MVKRFLFLLLVLICGIISPTAILANSRDVKIEATLKSAQEREKLHRWANSDTLELPDLDLKSWNSTTNTIPGWLQRTGYGVIIETDKKPRYYFETVQPLYQSTDARHTFFTHDRISVQNERGTYSAGLGYRRLVFEDDLLLGINTFFDYQDLHQHYRQGAGVEALGKYIELRANGYFGLSPKRLIEETSTAKTYEKAVNGGDIEIGAPIPYLPWVKIFGSYYRYDFRKFDDMVGWKVRGELKPFQFMVLNLETYDDNKGDQEYRMDGRLTLAFDDFTLSSICSALELNKESYPEINLKKRVLERVERNFNIQVEKWTETSGITVEVARK